MKKSMIKIGATTIMKCGKNIHVLINGQKEYTEKYFSDREAQEDFNRDIKSFQNDNENYIVQF